jgi:uncharacterized protein YycO
MPGQVRVIFSASNLIGSKIIRLLTWSSWSHVALLYGDDKVVEATYPKVRETSLDEFLKGKTLTLCVDLPCSNPEAVITAARSQLGKRYDTLAVLAFLWHFRDWEDDSKWFCSELVAYALREGGLPLFREGVLQRITPQHLWLLNPDCLAPIEK